MFGKALGCSLVIHAAAALTATVFFRPGRAPSPPAVEVGVSLTVLEPRRDSEPVPIFRSKRIQASPECDEAPDEQLFEKTVVWSEPLEEPVRPVETAPPRDVRPRITFKKLNRPDRATEEDSQARPVPGTNLPPRYPALARKRGWEGSVTLSVFVGEDGSVQSVGVETSSGHRTLDEAAVEAVRGWRFTPARKSGRAVASSYKVTFEFKLQ